MTVKCKRCCKEFKDNYNLHRHLNRKNPCKLLVSVDTKTTETDTKKLKSKESGHICYYCMGEFAQSSSLYRHINRCKVKKAQDQEKEAIFDKLVRQKESDYLRDLANENRMLKKELNEKNMIIKKSNIVNGTINNNSHNTNNTNNTINNNIKIVAFGKEDISHISVKEWIRILKRNYKSIEDLAMKTHFDKNKPENQNIYISNLHSKYIMVHNGNNWNVKNRKDTVDDLYDEKAYIIFNKVEELTCGLPLSIVDKFDEIKTCYDTDEIRKVLIKDLDLSLYNQRRIPICTHKIKDT